MLSLKKLLNKIINNQNWHLIATTTANNTTSIDLTGYREILIVVENSSTTWNPGGRMTFTTILPIPNLTKDVKRYCLGAGYQAPEYAYWVDAAISLTSFQLLNFRSTSAAMSLSGCTSYVYAR